MLAAGLPCPPFSLDGTQPGDQDERNRFPVALDFVDITMLWFSPERAPRSWPGPASRRSPSDFPRTFKHLPKSLLDPRRANYGSDHETDRRTAVRGIEARTGDTAIRTGPKEGQPERWNLACPLSYLRGRKRNRHAPQDTYRGYGAQSGRSEPRRQPCCMDRGGPELGHDTDTSLIRNRRWQSILSK